MALGVLCQVGRISGLWVWVYGFGVLICDDLVCGVDLGFLVDLLWALFCGLVVCFLECLVVVYGFDVISFF